MGVYEIHGPKITAKIVVLDIHKNSVLNREINENDILSHIRTEPLVLRERIFNLLSEEFESQKQNITQFTEKESKSVTDSERINNLERKLANERIIALERELENVKDILNDVSCERSVLEADRARIKGELSGLLGYTTGYTLDQTIELVKNKLTTLSEEKNRYKEKLKEVYVKVKELFDKVKEV